MDRLTSYVLHHRAIVAVLLAIFVVAGVNAFSHLPVEAYPDVTNVSFQVITLFPGHAAEEVERLVTIPIENVLNGIPRRASIRSISLFGLSQITIVFEDDTDRAYVRNQAYQLLSTVQLPPGAQAGLSPDSTPVGEIYGALVRLNDGPTHCALKPNLTGAVDGLDIAAVAKGMRGQVEALAAAIRPEAGRARLTQFIYALPVETLSPRDVEAGQ